MLLNRALLNMLRLDDSWVWYCVFFTKLSDDLTI